MMAVLTFCRTMYEMKYIAQIMMRTFVVAGRPERRTVVCMVSPDSGLKAQGKLPPRGREYTLISGSNPSTVWSARQTFLDRYAARNGKSGQKPAHALQERSRSIVRSTGAPAQKWGFSVAACVIGATAR